MPATSRSGERFSRRSGSGRAGSPSKSRITQPRSASMVWPRCSRRGCGSRGRRRRRATARCSCSRTSWPRPRDRRRARRSRAGRGRSARSARRRRGEERQRLGARLLGRERRVASRPSRARVCSSPVTAPSASQRGRAAPSGSLRQLVERQLPAVARAGQELLQDARASRRSAALDSYQPASGAMCGKPRSVRKRSSSSSGLTPGSTRRNTFRISSSPNTIDEFDCSTPTGRTSTVAAELGAAPLGPAEAKRAVAGLDSSPARIRCSSSRPCAGSASAS